MKRWSIILFISIIVLTACSKKQEIVQGYVEGNLIYQSSSQSGILTALKVQRGQSVQAGDELFALDPYPQVFQLAQAQAELASAQATLQNMERGLRPDEIKEIEADIVSTKAAIQYYQKEVKRYQDLSQQDYVPKSAYDEKNYQYHQNKAQLDRLQASLSLGRLGEREYAIKAQKQNVLSNEKEVAIMQWNASQKTVFSAGTGIVFDTYYKPGEWVAVGQPVVSLQMPENMYIIFFVSETSLARLHVGDLVSFSCDSFESSSTAKINYIASEAEYTPPVIYSELMREKLVYEVRASLKKEEALKFHPGQPIDVALNGK